MKVILETDWKEYPDEANGITHVSVIFREELEG